MVLLIEEILFVIFIVGAVLIEVPMVNPKSLAMAWRKTSDKSNQVAPKDTWLWWNNFRTYSDFDHKIFLTLELSTDIPSEEELKRWLGEPVSQLIIPTSIFIRNVQNFPVLTRAHQAVVSAFYRNNVSFLVKCNTEGSNVRQYAEYIRHICVTQTKKDPMQGYVRLCF